MLPNPNLKIILQIDFISLIILSRLPCMIGQPCACSCVRFSRGPGDLPSLLGGRGRWRGHWKNPEEDFHMSLEGGIGGGCRFLEETGSEMPLGVWTMLESTNLSSASPGLFNLRAKLSSDIYGAVPSSPILYFLGGVASKMCTKAIWKWESETGDRGCCHVL